MTATLVTFAPAEVQCQLSADPATRTLSGLAVPYGIPSAAAMDGNRYRFAGPPANAADLVDVVREHDTDAVVGRLGSPWSTAATGLSAVARIFATTAGNDTLVEASESVRAGFSVGADIISSTVAADGVIDITEWTADHLGVVRNPAFAAAAGVTVRLSTTQKEPTMTDNPTPPANPAPPAPPAVLELPTTAELAAQVAEVLAAANPPTPAHPLAAFSSRIEAYASFAAAVTAGDVERAGTIRAALLAAQNQVTTDNPGVIGMPPWARSLKANLDRRRPMIASTGGSIPLPEAGMQGQWPKFTGNLDAIITQQLAEKNELGSVKISITADSAPIKTAGVYSDISYQLLMRSSPSYLAQYMAICEAAWFRWTEAKYEAALAAAATGVGLTFALGTMTGDQLKALVWDASVKCENATGAPATVVGVSADIWAKVGTLSGLQNPKDGTGTNNAGTADASTNTVRVHGIAVTQAPFLAAKNVLTTNDVAAAFPESGAMTATQEDVTKLGRDVAVWGMYEDAEVYFPAGIVKSVLT